MKTKYFYVVIFLALFFISACYTYEDNITMEFTNNSSHDLHVILRMTHRSAEHRRNIYKGETISFNVVFSGRAAILVPVDRWSFQNIKNHVDRIIFINLENNEVIREMYNIHRDNFTEDHVFRTYRMQITDSLLFFGN